jgi:hypothetical protein
MAGQHMLLSSPAPSSLRRLPLPLNGQVQTQAMSHAKFIFLIALVVFFVVLFVAAYVWMRRPEFGQKGGRSIPMAPEGTVAEAADPAPSRHPTDGEVLPMDVSETSEGH